MLDGTDDKRSRLTQRIALALLGLGVVVGSAAAAVWALDWTPHVPDWMVRVALIKLGFVAAGGLLAAGSLLGRRARRAAHARPSVPRTDGPESLTAGPAREVEARREGVARAGAEVAPTRDAGETFGRHSR